MINPRVGRFLLKGTLKSFILKRIKLSVYISFQSRIGESDVTVNYEKRDFNNRNENIMRHLWSIGDIFEMSLILNFPLLVKITFETLKRKASSKNYFMLL